MIDSWGCSDLAHYRRSKTPIESSPAVTGEDKFSGSKGRLSLPVTRGLRAGFDHLGGNADETRRLSAN